MITYHPTVVSDGLVPTFQTATTSPEFGERGGGEKEKEKKRLAPP
jgi:hypothetical protein